MRIGPIHEYTADGKEVLRCPYRSCTRVDPFTGPGKKAMSVHMKRHREKGTPLQCTDGIYGVIQINEKYAEIEEDKDHEEVRANEAPEEIEAEPAIAEEWADQSEKALRKIKLNFVEWDEIPNSEFSEKVPYPMFAKAIMEHANYMHILIKSISSTIVNTIVQKDEKMAELKKKLDTLLKSHATTRKDMTAMTNTVLEKATELEGVGAQLNIANYLRESKDLREKFSKEGQDAVYDALNKGMEVYAKCLQNQVVKNARIACIETLRATQRIGLPKKGGLNDHLALMSKEIIEEDEAMDNMSELIVSMAPASAKRQLEAARSSKCVRVQGLEMLSKTGDKEGKGCSGQKWIELDAVE